MKPYPTPKNTTKTALAIVACAVAFLPQLAPALQFTYDVTVTGPSSFTTGGGPFGVITLTNSVVDPNRVDISVVLNGANLGAGATGLDNFYLNFNNAISLTGKSFKMVGLADPAGTFNGTSGDGTVNLNNQGLLGSMLDIKLDPAGSTPSLTFSASLVLREDAPPNHTESDLDVSMFDLKDATGTFFSQFNTLPSNQTFNYGAVTEVPSVPETGSTLGLLSLGLLALNTLRRKFGKA